MNTAGPDLLRAICLNPADTPLRLVYADWLEEHGEAERAEFIRVQCRISDLSHELMSDEDCKHPNCHGCMERRSLRHRELELLDGVHGLGIEALPIIDGLTRSNAIGGGYGWYRTGYPIEGVIAATFRRGFVEIVHCRLEDWYGTGECRGNRAGDCCQTNLCPVCHGTGRISGHGPSIVAAQPIREVRLVEPVPGSVHEFLHNHGGAVWPSTSSDLLIDWAREKAGLPALERPATILTSEH